MDYGGYNSNITPEIAEYRILERISVNGLVLSPNPDDYPRWIVNDCGISDPYSQINALIDRGLVTIAPLDVCLNKLSVAELKAELSRQGLSNKGKKDELISLLVSYGNIPEDFAPKVAILTDSGHNYLQENEEKMFAESLQRFEVSANEYFLCKKELGSQAKREIIAIAALEIKSCVEGLDMWTYIDIHKELARLYDKIGNKTKALIHYIYEAYYLCCLNANILEFTTNIDTEQRTSIYFHRDFFEPYMVDSVESLIIPLSERTTRYNIERFRRQIYDVLHSSEYEITTFKGE